jgi:cell division septum initiation protein DivIVA
MSTRRDDLPKKQKELRATTAQRLEEIVEAAERAAEGVIDDAEAQARRYLTQARAEADRITDRRMEDLTHMIDVLLDQADLLQREADRMQTLLEEAKFRISPEQPGGGQPAAADREEPVRPTRPQPPRETPKLRAVAHPEEPAAEVEAAPGDAAGARLLATQMAVSGSSREEIETRLRKRFEIEDTSPILDAILGPES